MHAFILIKQDIHNYINPKNLIKFKINEGFYTSLYMLMELRWGKGRLGGWSLWWGEATGGG